MNASKEAKFAERFPRFRAMEAAEFGDSQKGLGFRVLGDSKAQELCGFSKISSRLTEFFGGL